MAVRPVQELVALMDQVQQAPARLPLRRARPAVRAMVARSPAGVVVHQVSPALPARLIRAADRAVVVVELRQAVRAMVGLVVGPAAVVVVAVVPAPPIPVAPEQLVSSSSLARQPAAPPIQLRAR
jgi:hypothetical protein